MTVMTSSRADIDPWVRRAAALGRNRARVTEHSEDDLRGELVRRFPSQQAVRAGIDGFREVRRSIQQ